MTLRLSNLTLEGKQVWETRVSFIVDQREREHDQKTHSHLCSSERGVVFSIPPAPDSNIPGPVR